MNNILKQLTLMSPRDLRRLQSAVLAELSRRHAIAPPVAHGANGAPQPTIVIAQRSATTPLGIRVAETLRQPRRAA
jgi:hypothetical protein